MLTRIVQSCSCHFTAHTQTQTHTQVTPTHKVTEEPESSPPTAAPPSTGCGSSARFPPKKGLVTRTVREGCDGKFTFRSRSELALAGASFLFFFFTFLFFQHKLLSLRAPCRHCPLVGIAVAAATASQFQIPCFSKTFNC